MGVSQFARVSVYVRESRERRQELCVFYICIFKWEGQRVGGGGWGGRTYAYTTVVHFAYTFLNSALVNQVFIFIIDCAWNNRRSLWFDRQILWLAFLVLFLLKVFSIVSWIISPLPTVINSFLKTIAIPISAPSKSCTAGSARVRFRSLFTDFTLSFIPTFWCSTVILTLFSCLSCLAYNYVTRSLKRGFKSICSPLRYWYSKKVHNMQINWVFGSSLYVEMQSSQLK